MIKTSAPNEHHRAGVHHAAQRRPGLRERPPEYAIVGGADAAVLRGLGERRANRCGSADLVRTRSTRVLLFAFVDGGGSEPPTCKATEAPPIHVAAAGVAPSAGPCGGGVRAAGCLVDGGRDARRNARVSGARRARD